MSGAETRAKHLNAHGARPKWVAGRYAIFDEIAAGGMASVHIGRLLGPAGFGRIVAVKRLHSHIARDPEFVTMFLDEARLAARIRHPNVVSTLDVVALGSELFVVMDYVEGESLARLRRAAAARGERLPLSITTTIIADTLHGLHAAHEARAEDGSSLGLVHRDVSPQNVLVGVDGISRVVDFGVAKAAGRLQATREGVLKGKIPYMAPEQLQQQPIDRRIDVYAVGVVLWEILTGRRLYSGDNDFVVAREIIDHGMREPPSRYNPDVSSTLDAIVLRAASRNPDERFASAQEMALSIEGSAGIVSPRAVGAVVSDYARVELSTRAELVAAVENAPSIEVAADVERASVPQAVAPADADVASDVVTRALSPAPVTRVTKPVAMKPRAPVDDEPGGAQSGVSQISSWSSSRGRDRRRALLWGMALGLVLVASIAAVIKLVWPSPGAVEPAAASAMAPSVTTASAPVASAAPASSATKPPENAPLPSATASASAPSKPASTRPTKPPRRSLSCADYPWTVDNRGNKRLRPECL